jgi:response regulator RpfG family c-di-GMP phosphodiesterase
MTGMDLHRELMLVSPDQASKMVFLTGGAFTAKARAFMAATTVEHIEKPFEPAGLRARVRHILLERRR